MYMNGKFEAIFPLLCCYLLYLTHFKWQPLDTLTLKTIMNNWLHGGREHDVVYASQIYSVDIASRLYVSFLYT